MPNHNIPEVYVRARATRAYKVITDAMIGIGILEGSVIFAKPTVNLDAADREIAIVRLNKTLFLSENPIYADIHVGNRDTLELVGIVVP